MAKIAAPCKDCKRRAVGCQSACTDYTEYKKQLAAARAEDFKAHGGDMIFHAYAARSRYRHLKEKRRKGK